MKPLPLQTDAIVARKYLDGRIAAEELPKYIYKNGKARWWSESQKKYMSVFITSIDEEKQLIFLAFHINPESWKAVRFLDVVSPDDGFEGGLAETCPLQPLPAEEQVQNQSQEQVMDDLIGDLQDDMMDLVNGLNTSRDTYELSDSDDESPSHVFGGGESSVAPSSKPATAASSPAKMNFDTPASSPAKSS